MGSTAVPPAPAPGARRPGRPRSEKAQAAILAAAQAMLEEQGLRAMSVDAVAARAGVSKATIYRWWRSKSELALDAFTTDVLRRVPLEETGSLAGDLRARARAIVRAYARPPLGPALAALIGEAQADPGFALALRERAIRPLRADSLEIFTRAKDRGEIAREVSIDVGLDMLVGPIYYRLLLGTGPLDAAFADALADLLVGALAREPGRRRSR